MGQIWSLKDISRKLALECSVRTIHMKGGDIVSRGASESRGGSRKER